MPDKADKGRREGASLEEFTPVPRQERMRPGRRRLISGELFLDRYLEHREASAILDEVMKGGRGEGLNTIVRALLHYRETVLEPLAEAEKRRGGKAKAVKPGSARPRKVGVSPGQLQLT